MDAWCSARMLSPVKWHMVLWFVLIYPGFCRLAAGWNERDWALGKTHHIYYWNNIVHWSWCVFIPPQFFHWKPQSLKCKCVRACQEVNLSVTIMFQLRIPTADDKQPDKALMLLWKNSLSMKSQTCNSCLDPLILKLSHASGVKLIWIQSIHIQGSSFLIFC